MSTFSGHLLVFSFLAVLVTATRPRRSKPAYARSAQTRQHPSLNSADYGTNIGTIRFTA
ncbi:hypothetical protein [Frondihabitans peucedani]